MSHPATFFPVQLIEQVRTCWSRDEDVSGLEYRRFNDDDIKGITDVWLEFKIQINITDLVKLYPGLFGLLNPNFIV